MGTIKIGKGGVEQVGEKNWCALPRWEGQQREEKKENPA